MAINHQLKKLVERKMLQPVSDGARQYTFGFSNNYLMRGVIRALSAEGFIPETLNEEKNSSCRRYRNGR